MNNSKSFMKLMMVALLALSFGFSSAEAKTAKKKRAKPARITFEQCCEKHEGDTDKCQGMKNVKKKKEKMGKKWAKKSCPKPAMDDDADTAEADEETDTFGEDNDNG